METIKCNACEEEKPESEFYRIKYKKANGENVTYPNKTCKTCTKNKSNEWQVNNRERSRELKRNHGRKPSEKAASIERSRKTSLKGTRKEWRRKNKDKVKKYNEQYSNKKHDITQLEWDSCRLYFNYRCAYCDMTYEDQFKNFKKDLNREHVDCEGLDDLSNCIPSCTPCNSSKHIYDFYDWYNELNPIFLQKKYDKIIMWLMNDYKVYIDNSKKKKFE